MNLTITLHSSIFWFIFVIGACIGSFLNVVILRVPEGTFFKNSRSVCPSCSTVIPFWFNIPIFSWLFLRARARCCGAKLSIQYPVVELLTALIFGYCYFQHPFLGWTFDRVVFDINDCYRFFHAVLFTSVMLVCSVIDIRLMIIPDKISLPMIALTPLVAWLHPELDMISALLGVLLGGGFLYGVAWLYWFVRKEYGMGFGDVKLLAAIGGWLGYQAVFPTLFLGSIIGSIIGISVLLLGKKFSWKAQLPFGPFLACGAIMHLWWGAEIFAMITSR